PKLSRCRWSFCGRSEADMESEPQRHRSPLERIERHTGSRRIEEAVDRLSARTHPPRHLRGRDPLRLHGLLDVCREDPLLHAGAKLVKLAELGEELLQLVPRWSHRHVPSFIRRCASAMSAAGAFWVFL